MPRADEQERPTPRKSSTDKVPHEERRRLLLERLERTALRSACSGIGDPDGAVDALYVAELARRLQKGEPLPPRERKTPEES